MSWDELTEEQQKELVRHVFQLAREAADSLGNELTRMSQGFGAPFEFQIELTMSQRKPRPADIVLERMRPH